MYLDGYTLEVLVNNRPLQEYHEPVGTNPTTTGTSYALVGPSLIKHECPEDIYVAVPEVGARFSVRFSTRMASCSTPIMGEIFLDGKNDYTNTNISDPIIPAIRDGFWNESRDKMAYFKFSRSMWSNPKPHNNASNKNKDPKENRGGLGAVSLYFYRGKYQIQSVVSKKFSLEQTAVPEHKSNKGIEISISFDPEPAEAPPNLKNKVATMARMENEPIAVLHIHYRPIPWMIVHGLITSNRIPRNLLRRFDVASEQHAVQKYIPSTLNPVKQEVINQEIEVIDLTSMSHKRKLNLEIIEILSSDDEGPPQKIVKTEQ
ncbi:hypothetical protein G9A89_018181 [Geosiphon pyriformis]|nr:hypothetical protein G9A89_018181 [Geosiphon pyriformis]